MFAAERGRRATFALFLLAASALTACSPGTDDGRAGDTASTVVVPASTPQTGVAATLSEPPTPRPRLTPSRDADQDFLRHMLDHHETVLLTVHAQMMETQKHAEHGTASDPVELDAQLDKEKLEMLAMLKQYYGEDYSPWATATGAASPERDVPGMPMPPGKSHDSMQSRRTETPSPLAGQLRDGAALAQRLAPALTRPAVRALALRIRASQLALAKRVDGESTP